MTGIPMEFQFGTNWSDFARRTGGVIGQPLAMEGVFSLLSRIGIPRAVSLRREAALEVGAFRSRLVMVWLGSWISGFFIIVTDAWMQHPVAYRMLSDGKFEVTSFRASY